MDCGLHIHNLDFDKDTREIIVTFGFDNAPSSNDNFSFAYYVFKNDKRIDTVWYEKIPSENQVVFKYKPICSGKYSFRVFVKDQRGNKYSEYSNSVFVDLLKFKTIKSSYKNEEIFYLDTPVKYLFQRSKTKSPYLLVVFSGLHTNEYEGGNAVYNYVRTLKGFDCNKLFVLDEYEEQFCYYLGHGCRHDYERAVIALITTKANELRISPDNIIACGSSKGGTAALYYSMKYHFGKVISGAPQIFISNFLISMSPDRPAIQRAHNNLIGDDKESGEMYINQLILDLVEQNNMFPELYFHIGEGDYHYEEHLTPLFKKLKQKEVMYSLDIQSYSNHSMTGTYYAPFLVSKLEEMLNLSPIQHSEVL